MKWAIIWGFAARGWGLASGLLLTWLVATHFNREQQGFYYTFNSLLALQIFFELGLSSVLLQFAGQEFAFLQWQPDGRIEGDPFHQARLLTLARQARKWFGVASLLFGSVLIPLGLVFFAQHPAPGFSWRLPWVLAVGGIALNLKAVPLWAIISGGGLVRWDNFRTLIGGICGALGAAGAISSDYGLYAVPIISCANGLTAWLGLLLFFPGFLRQIRGSTSQSGEDVRLSWWEEIWPMQWRIAVSWMAGYFIFQLFTPTLFAFQGPVVAGQMGLTLAATNAVLALGVTWTTARNPELCRLIAQREDAALDRYFRRLLVEVTAVALVSGGAALALIDWLQGLPRFAGRFLPTHLVGIQMMSTLINLWSNALATYCRAHKSEPFMVPSVVGALLQGGIVLYCGKFHSVREIVVGTLLLHLTVGLPWAVAIWNQQRHPRPPPHARSISPRHT